jgi:uncharacterized glyoxalase superfamily protein PhnB
MVKFGYTINYVSDVERALSFFEEAFAMKRKFITDEKDYGELETGETVLSFASHELGKSNFQGGYVSASESKEPLGIEIALITDNVASAHSNAIEAGAVELKSPESKPWGQVVSYVRCPSGILLELCSPIIGS